jgi:hypothetical protein
MESSSIVQALLWFCASILAFEISSLLLLMDQELMHRAAALIRQSDLEEDEKAKVRVFILQDINRCAFITALDQSELDSTFREYINCMHHNYLKLDLITYKINEDCRVQERARSTPTPSPSPARIETYMGAFSRYFRTIYLRKPWHSPYEQVQQVMVCLCSICCVVCFHLPIFSRRCRLARGCHFTLSLKEGLQFMNGMLFLLNGITMWGTIVGFRMMGCRAVPGGVIH